MIVVIEVAALLSLLLVAWLIYLTLFERGPLYRTTDSVCGLDDEQRLALLGALLATPVQSVHSASVLREGSELYFEQARAIRAARRSVHLEAYIFHPGQAADTLIAAMCECARRGVRVRVIVDAIGSLRTRYVLFAPLIAAGGQVQRYHPLHLHMFRRWNSRTHRNLLVIDSEVAFIGGAGVAQFWARTDPPPWRDCVLRVTGPVVSGLQAVFAENWLECAGELLVGIDAFPASNEETRTGAVHSPALAVGSTPTAGRSTRARVLVQFLLATARESIDLCSPYFVPDLGIRRELLAARARGVRVRILTGGPYSDHGLVRRAGRRRYGTLLESGVEIREYSPRMMHVKLLVVDGRWALVGSTNIDNRSFGLNDEVNLLVLGGDTHRQLATMFEQDLAHSERLELASWRRRSLGERALAMLGRALERHQ